jgi:hypothetical protein
MIPPRIGFANVPGRRDGHCRLGEGRHTNLAHFETKQRSSR